jgi:precorrin-2 dehydrogenase/sirohydrochlorin ferrochelatase
MASPYPIFLNLAGRPCLVVGGGRVAARKVEGLLAAGAEVTVVAPRLVAALREAADRGEVAWRRRPFEPKDLEGIDLGFVATSDPRANRMAAEEARVRGVWLNVADDPTGCDFLVPAVVRRGGAQIAVSTGGASPALAAWLRDHIAGALPEGIDALVEVARGLRRSAPRRGGSAFRELFASGVLEDLAAGNWAEADRKVARCFGVAPGVRELLERPSMEAR